MKYRLLISDKEAQYHEYATKAHAQEDLKAWVDGYKRDKYGRINKEYIVTYNKTQGKALVETATEIIGFACIFPICQNDTTTNT